MREQDLIALIEPILRERLSDVGFERATIEAGRDFDGDPALFVDVFFDGRHGALEGRTFLGTIGAVRRALLERDEERFPYLRLHIPDVPDEAAA